MRRYTTLKLFLLVLIIGTLAQCKAPRTDKTTKFGANDPFRNSMTPSQTFTIDTKQDNIVEGVKGTIIVCPKGCFLNAQGSIIDNMVQLELAEALSLDDAVLSNLTTSSNGNFLETDGMIYYNVTSNGEQLYINQSNPVYIQIPTKTKKPGMQVYKGIRDEQGNINWVEPKALENYLVPRDINSLDFLPAGFSNTVKQNMPYKNYKTATPELIDSLYYSLSGADNELIKVLFGKSNVHEEHSEHHAKEKSSNLGIDPAIIKTIKTPAYNNTLIATKEFETRLQTIFETCDDRILELYIKNFDKNLYEIDEMAAAIEPNSQKQAFADFAKQKLTNVKEPNKCTQLLNAYYDKRLSAIKAEISAKQAEALKAKEKQAQIEAKAMSEYKQLLVQRETYRMETYGFTRTETGWINIDNGTVPKDWEEQEIELNFANTEQYSQVYVYVINTTIKTLLRLESTDKKLFKTTKAVPLPKDKDELVVAIGYKDLTPSAIITGQLNEIYEKQTTLSLIPTTHEKIKKQLITFDSYPNENNIKQDLITMEKQYKINLRRKTEYENYVFMSDLFLIAYPCADITSLILQSIRSSET